LKYGGGKDGEKREITEKRLVGDFILFEQKNVSGFQDSTGSTQLSFWLK
jgi:hypothetical protein